MTEKNRQTFIQNNLKLRSKIVKAIRAFFESHDYLEVETPICIPAPAPEAYIDAISCEDLYLHTSPELCMKRLVASGYARIFQICKCFRKEEEGQNHLPEFTLLEWYHTGSTYLDLMRQCEQLILYIANFIGLGETFTHFNTKIDLSPPWNYVTVAEAFEKFAPVSLDDALNNNTFDEVVAFEIEPHLGIGKPVFLYDYPSEKGALATLKKNDPNFAERFELYIAGIELCNGFTELTDAKEQRRRFEEEQVNREKMGALQTPMPEKFLQALAFMPDVAGNALGVDRLIMLLTNCDNIEDVVTFVPGEL